MIALIALIALATIAGFVIGVIVIAAALIKAILRGFRRHGDMEPLDSAEPKQPLDQQLATDQEFFRLMRPAWNSSTEPE